MCKTGRKPVNEADLDTGRTGGGGPGRHRRKSLSIHAMAKMFSTERKARLWLESVMWPDGPQCPHCESKRISAKAGSKSSMTHRCLGCKKRFSVRSISVMRHTRLSYAKWATAIYAISTQNLHGVSAMQLRRDLDITHKSAWFLLHRLRKARDCGALPPLEGVEGVEADETYIGGRAANKHASKRRRRADGTIEDDKVIVAGVKDRATKQNRLEVVPNTGGATLRGFVERNTSETAHVYTDENPSYRRLDRSHSSVNHGRGIYVGEDGASTNEMESLWAEVKRAVKGTFRKVSPKHTSRYLSEFSARANFRNEDTLDHMAGIARGMVGRRLRYRELIADNGLKSHARPTADMLLHRAA